MALLGDLVQARGIPPTARGHAIPGSLCFDCLQTPGDQIAERVRCEAELKAEFNAARRPWARPAEGLGRLFQTAAQGRRLSARAVEDAEELGHLAHVANLDRRVGHPVPALGKDG